MLTLLRGVCGKRRVELLDFLAAAGRTGGIALLMLFQRKDDQGFLAAVLAFVVVHRHGSPFFSHSLLVFLVIRNPSRLNDGNGIHGRGL